MFRGPLRDAFNREVYPQAGSTPGTGMNNMNQMNINMSQNMNNSNSNYGQPSQTYPANYNNGNMKGGACAPISPGPPAYESATPFGNIGGDSFGNVSTYNNETMFDQGPSYKLPGVHMGAGSGYGAMGFLSNYSSPQEMNRYGRQPGGYGGPTPQQPPHQQQVQEMFQQAPQQQQTGSGCLPCQGGQPPQQQSNQMVNDFTWDDDENQGNNENNESAISASHMSVNRELVRYLRKSIIKLSRQLKIKPDWVDLSPDGGASWKYSSMVAGNSIWCRVFTKVEVHGERKGCKRPLPHICNVTTTTKIKLDSELVLELQKEFPMMSYCSSTNNLQLTMDSLEHNLSMLALICACQQDKISLDNIKYYDLPKKYMLLTTPGSKRYHAAAKYSLIRQIRT